MTNISIHDLFSPLFRITSYNVCYTKLLRPLCRGGKARCSSAQRSADIRIDGPCYPSPSDHRDDRRITSYNVCYTKLLRGLLGGSFFAIDGCKMSSNASKEWSGKINDLQKRKEKIESRLKALVEDHIEIDKEEHAVREKLSASREKQIRRLERQAAIV